MPLLHARDVIFLKLQPAVLCIECELISYNNTDHCLACGSHAVMSLSHLLGGSLRGGVNTRIVREASLQRAMADVLASSGVVELPAAARADTAGLTLKSAMGSVVQQAFRQTGADGAVLAMLQGGKIRCTSKVGSLAPELGTEVQPDCGITGLCLRTARTLRCDDAWHSSYVDVRSCRDSGIRSITVAPLTHVDSVIGILEVLSSDACAFDDHHVATVQLLASLMVVALTQRASIAYQAMDHHRLNASLPGSGLQAAV
jgi:GAF domain-containing protein